MTREEFERYYAKNSNISLEQLKALGFRAVECGCGEEGCLGWAATFPDRDEGGKGQWLDRGTTVL